MGAAAGAHVRPGEGNDAHLAGEGLFAAVVQLFQLLRGGVGDEQMCIRDSCTASKEGFGGNTFFRANKDGISVNFGNWRNHIFERIIGTSFLEKIHDAHIPNTTKPQEEDCRQYDYVYEHINQFVVLANSGEYFGGSHDDIKSGFHYILAAAKHNDSPFILRHELGHGLFHLGDEYSTSTTPVGEASYRTSLNMSHTADPKLVK